MDSSKGQREPIAAVYRTRRRNGLRCVRVLLHETEIDVLIEKGFLKPERRHRHGAVEDALSGFICDALGPPAEER